MTLPIDPPKRGGDLPGGWRTVVADTAASLFDSSPLSRPDTRP
ncbi:hypothetical protein [Halegenticoccus tardaugens]|nr:hypothetical protein [Halegenticoccus tardaugens]